MTVKKGPLIAAATLGFLLCSWLLPPVAHRMLALCPVRPGGPVRAAQAVPAFARRNGMSCTQCHVAFPALNDFGRQFKLSGYVAGDDEDGLLATSTDTLRMLKALPVGAVAVVTPYDKSQDDREFKMTPANVLKVSLAGGNVAGKDLSIYSQLDAAPSEADQAGGEAAVVRLSELQVGYHPSQYFNILAGNRSFFVMDPYQTLANMGVLTATGRKLSGLGQTSLDTLDNMDAVKQTIAAYGTVDRQDLGTVYYSAGVSAGKNAPQGEGPKSSALRVAFDTSKGVMVGAFGSFGQTGGGVPPAQGMNNPANKFKFSRVGLDSLVELAGFVARGVYMHSYDRDLANPPAAFLSNGNENNRAAYAELFYTFKKDDRPFVAPLIRQDWYSTNDGKRQYGAFTAQLAHYVKENIRWFVEYSADTKQDLAAGALPGDPRAPKGHRWLAQVELGF